LKLLGATVGIGLLVGCSSTRNMQVLTARPANITVDKSVKRIAIVNRSIGNEKSILEGILTGELPGKDMRLSRECITGLNQALCQSNRFTVTVYDRELASGSGTSTQLGPNLSWNVVGDICRQSGADAVLALEFFDSDFTVGNFSKASKTSDKVAVNNTATPLFYAGGTASATAGFRLYNNLNRTVIYEDSYRHNRVWKESARTYLEAAAKLLKKNDALLYVSRDLGANFSKQLIPMSYWEQRLMFKGKSALGIKGERLALTKNWEAAEEAWIQAYNSTTDLKERGALAYNIALANEVLGDYDKAKKWVTTAYTENGDSRALQYSKIIDGLLYDRQRFQQNQ